MGRVKGSSLYDKWYYCPHTFPILEKHQFKLKKQDHKKWILHENATINNRGYPCCPYCGSMLRINPHFRRNDIKRQLWHIIEGVHF